MTVASSRPAPRHPRSIAFAAWFVGLLVIPLALWLLGALLVPGIAGLTLQVVLGEERNPLPLAVAGLGAGLAVACGRRIGLIGWQVPALGLFAAVLTPLFPVVAGIVFVLAGGDLGLD